MMMMMMTTTMMMLMMMMMIKLKEKSVSYTRKTFDRFTTADSCTWNITHNTESTAV
jgi:hypothetical protein